jgi:hypothetical protein
LFYSPSPNLFESDEGFSVEVLGRTGLRYRENGKSAFVDSEVMATAEMVVWKQSIRKWDPPHETEVIDDKGRERILSNILRAFRALGHEIDVTDGRY